MEKKVILSFLKEMKVAHFEKKTEGNILGSLVYTDYCFIVKLYRDAVCQYICLEYLLDDLKNTNDWTCSINERLIAGKFTINDSNVILQSFFPIIEGDFIEQQIKNSILVIERMIHICKH